MDLQLQAVACLGEQSQHSMDHAIDAEAGETRLS